MELYMEKLAEMLKKQRSPLRLKRRGNKESAPSWVRFFVYGIKQPERWQ